MKKRVTLLLMLLGALLFTTPSGALAQVLTAGDRITIDQISDGMQFLFEGASESVSNGKYMPQLPEASGTATYITATLDSGSIYQLEAAGTTNSVTGTDEWRIKNVKTGGYVKRGSDDNYYLVGDKFDADKFCIQAASDTVYGAVPKTGDVSLGWDESSITFAIVNSADDIHYINNHFFVVIEGNGRVIGWTYRDTNPWNLRTPVWSDSYKDKLANYLESFPESALSSYVYGTDPGFINDEAIVNDLSDAYNDAVSASDPTEEQAQTLYEALVKAREAADDSTKTVPIADDAYYYIYTANPDYVDAGNGDYAITIYDDTHIGWKAFDDADYKFIWHFTKQADGNYLVQNASTGAYIDRADPNDWSVDVKFSTTEKTEQVLSLFANNGHWNIHSSANDAELMFHQNGHGGGKPSKWENTIVTWTADAGASQWFLRAVPQETLDALLNNADLTALKTAVNDYKGITDGLSIGTAPFQFPQTSVDDFAAAYKAGEDLLASGGTNEEYKNAAQAIKDAYSSLLSSRNTIKEGYYQIVNGFPEYQKQQNVEKAMYAGDTQAKWASLDSTAKFIWKITPVEASKYTVKNILNDKYLGGPATNDWSANVQVTDEVDTVEIAPYNLTSLTVKINSVRYDVQYHTAGHGGGSGSAGNIVTWPSDAESASSWIIREAEVPSDLAATHLAALLPTAGKAYTSAFSYIPDTSKPVLTDESQITAVNQETSEGAIKWLIDGVKKTDNSAQNYFHSSWSNSEITDNYHSLTFQAGDDGFPDPVILTFTTRVQNNSIAPTTMNILVSNDGETFTPLTTIYNTTALAGDQDFVSTEIPGVSGYKYFRMEVTETVTGGADNNGHPYFALTEANLYPSLGMDPGSQAGDAEVKANAYALKTLVDAAADKIANKTATEDDVTAMQAAIDALKASFRDTTALAAKVVEASNLELTVGNALGNVTQEAYDAYHAAVDPIIAQQPLYKLSKQQLADNLAALDAAIAEVRTHIVPPSSDKWYFIQSADNTRSTNSFEQYICQTANAVGNAIKNQTIDAESLGLYTRNAWNFVSADGKLYLRNVGNGHFQSTHDAAAGYPPKNIATTDTLPSADAWELVSLGDDQYALKAAGKDLYLTANSTNLGNSDWHTPTVSDLKNTEYAFTIKEVDEVLSTEQMAATQDDMRKGAYRIYSSPVAITSIAPSDDSDATFTVYTISGKNTSDDGKTISFNLKQYEEEVIPAGMPFILMADGSLDSGEMTGEFYFNSDINAPVVFVSDTVNGLVSVANATTLKDGVGYINTGADRDKVTAASSSITVSDLTGYIDPELVTSNEEGDAVIIVKGDGIVNAIQRTQTAGISAKATVNVYTIDGVLVKKGVKAANAKSGLKKGLYIVGGKKVLVK